MVNLRGIDLNLLTVFEAVYEERSQVRAGQRLGMTQPAVSNALSRLRDLVDDRLFQASPRGLVPTTRADRLYLRVRRALGVVREGLREREPFDPATSTRTFVVSMDYGGGAFFGLRLLERIREEAPGVRLVIRDIDPEDEIPSELRAQRLDLAVHKARIDDAMLEQPLLHEHELVVVARRDHPRIRKAPSVAQLLRENLVHVRERRSVAPEEWRGPLRRIADRVTVEVPNALLLALVVERTDLVAVTLAAVVESGGFGRLVRYPLPAPPPVKAQAFLIWHRSRTADPAHAWLREVFRGIGNRGGAGT